MKRILALLLLLSTSLQAVLIPANKLGTWGEPGVGVGVVGGIPNRTSPIINVSLSTGDSDVSGEIQTAINNAAAGSVILLPAGTYNCTGTISLNAGRDNLTLRGAGMDVTILRHSGSNHCIIIGNDTEPDWQPVGGVVVTSSGITKGATSLTVADASQFVVGNVMNIGFSDRTNNAVIQAGGIPIGMGNPYTIAAGNLGNLRQVVRITSKSGNTINFSPPIQSHTSDLNSKIWQMHPAIGNCEYTGIEDLTVDSTTGTNARGVVMTAAVNCWIKNVKSKNPGNYPFMFNGNVNCELRKSWAHDLRGGGGGSNGAGVVFASSSSCLMEDNIVYHVFPGWEINFGASNNVFAYNYVDMAGVGHAGMLVNHGPHNAFNLYEGNMTSFMSDGYFGGSSEDTLFRNWTSGREGYCITLKRFSRQYNIIGNITGTPGSIAGGYDFGFPNIGNADWTGTAQPTAGDFWADWPEVVNLPSGWQEKDLDVELSANIKGNFKYGAGGSAGSQESTGGDTIPTSLFRSSKPTYFGNLTWPPYDPATGVTGDTRIPAGYRYINGVDPPGGPADTTPPVLNTKTITPPGNQITFVFSEPVAIGLGGNGGWTINMTGGAATLSYASGSGTTTLVYNISRTISAGQTGTVSYVQPGNGVEDTSGNDLASLSNSAVTNTTAGDTTAPIPNPSTFGIAPSALTSSTITMTATTSTDSGTPPVQYFFNETSGNAGGSDSGWQSSATFTDAGLAAGTQYSYRVQTRDSAVPPNVTTFSGTFSAITKSVAGAHPAMPFNMARANIVTP